MSFFILLLWRHALVWFGFMVLNATFNNISVIAWLLHWCIKLDYSGKTTNLSKVNDILYHIILYLIRLAWAWFEFTTLVETGNDCAYSCKFNYYTINATTTEAIKSPWLHMKHDLENPWLLMIEAVESLLSFMMQTIGSLWLLSGLPLHYYHYLMG